VSPAGLVSAILPLVKYGASATSVKQSHTLSASASLDVPQVSSTAGSAP